MKSLLFILLFSTSAFAGDEILLQQHIDLAVKSKTKYVQLEPGKIYVLDSGVKIPSFIGGVMPSFTIQGNGATMQIKKGYAISKLVIDQSDAAKQVGSRVFIDNINFIGGGILLQASYGSGITRCTFTQCDTAINLQFCMMADVRQNFFLRNKSCDILLTTGAWKGAGVNNSQCNQTVLAQNRHYASDGQLSCISVYRSSNISINDCIFEGGNPIVNVIADMRICTTSKSLYINRPHIENNPSGASFQLCPSGGIYRIENIWSQIHHTLISVPDCQGYTIFYISAPRYPSTVGLFKQGAAKKSGVSWMVEFNGFQKLTDAAWVIDSLSAVPYYRKIN